MSKATDANHPAMRSEARGSIESPKVCPFVSPDFNIGFDTPCPVCGAVGADDDDVIDAKCSAAIAQATLPAAHGNHEN